MSKGDKPGLFARIRARLKQRAIDRTSGVKGNFNFYAETQYVQDGVPEGGRVRYQMNPRSWAEQDRVEQVMQAKGAELTQELLRRDTTYDAADDLSDPRNPHHAAWEAARKAAIAGNTPPDAPAPSTGDES